MVRYFRLTALQAKIDEACRVSKEEDRSIALRGLPLAIARAGNIRVAFAVANYIPNQFLSWDARKDVFSHLVRIGNVNTVIKVVTSKPDRYRRCEALVDIARSLIRTGRINDVMILVLRAGLPDRGLQDISIALAKNGNFDRAIKVASSISGEYDRGVAILGICNALTSSKCFDRAIYIAQSNLNGELKASAFLDIIHGLAMNGDFDRAIGLAGARWVSLLLYQDSVVLPPKKPDHLGCQF